MGLEDDHSQNWRQKAEGKFMQKTHTCVEEKDMIVNTGNGHLYK